MKYTLVFLSLVIGFSISAQNTTVKTIHISADMSFQNYEHYNRLVLDSEDSSAEYIEGFNFEWGYEYELKVEETDLVEALSDGTQFDYQLVEVLSKTKMPKDAEFKLFLDPEIYNYTEEGLDSKALKKVGDNTYRYLEKVDLVVPDDLMMKFLKLLKEPNGRLGTFQFLDTQKILLVKL